MSHKLRYLNGDETVEKDGTTSLQTREIAIPSNTSLDECRKLIDVAFDTICNMYSFELNKNKNLAILTTAMSYDPSQNYCVLEIFETVDSQTAKTLNSLLGVEFITEYKKYDNQGSVIESNNQKMELVYFHKKNFDSSALGNEVVCYHVVLRKR